MHAASASAAVLDTAAYTPSGDVTVTLKDNTFNAITGVGSLPSNIKIVEDLHLDNTYYGFWIMAFGFPTMYYFVFKSAYKSIPMSLSESARIDGANNFQIFIKINLPLVRITFLSVFVLMFVGYWNNYSTPLAFAPEIPTVAYGFWYSVVRNTHLEKTQEIAGAMIMVIPMLIMFIFANKFGGKEGLRHPFRPVFYSFF